MDGRKIMYRQLICVIPMCCMYFMVGLARGWVAPILSRANDPDSELPLTNEQSSWLASVGYVFRCFSPIVASLLLDRIGRKSVTVMNALVLFGAWIAVYWSRDIIVHYVVRAIAGLAEGTHLTAVSIYVCENASPRFRGIFITLLMAFLFTGHLVVFVFAAYCSYECVALAYAAFGFVTLLSTTLLVETPQYFLLKGRADEAEKSFRRLRDMNDPASLKEFEAIKRNVEEEKKRKFDITLFRSKEVVRSLRVLLVVMMMSAECGFPAAATFVTKLLSDSSGASSANQLSIIYGIFQLISVCASSTIIERFNRKTLMMLSCALMTVINAGVVLLYYLRYINEIPYFNLILFAMLTIFSCVCSMFMFPLLTLLRGELLPQRVKMVGAGLGMIAFSSGCFINVRTFLPIAEAFGVEANFVVFSCFSIILAAYAYFDLPETRGKTLVEIQNELKGASSKKEIPELEVTHL